MPSLLSARSPISSSVSLTLSPPKHPLRNKFASFSSTKPYSQPAVKMSSTAIEHVVLFKVKDGTDSTKVNTMLTSINGLISLDSIIHLTAGPLHHVKFSPIPFTHMAHSRYSSKENLNAYASHPSHDSVVKGNITLICDDIMAVDWVANAEDLQGGLVLALGSAIRVMFMKLKENLGEKVNNEILTVIKDVKGSFRDNATNQITYGENFSPIAKGYSIAALAVFSRLSEMEMVNAKEKLVNLIKEKVKDYLDSVIVVDYVVPCPPSSSL